MMDLKVSYLCGSRKFSPCIFDIVVKLSIWNNGDPALGGPIMTIVNTAESQCADSNLWFMRSFGLHFTQVGTLFFAQL